MANQEGRQAQGEGRRSAALASFVGNFANTFLVSIQAVVLVPFILGSVGPVAYGAWLAVGDLLNWVQVLDLGLPNLLIQRVGAAQGQQEPEVAGRWFLTGAAVVGGVSVILMALGALLSMGLAGIFHIQGAVANVVGSCFRIGCVAAGISLFNNVFIGFGRGIQQTKFMNGVVFLGSLLGLIATLGLLWRGLGLWAVACGMLVRALGVLVGGIWFLYRQVPASMRSHFKFDAPVMREYLRSVPAMSAGGIGYVVVSQSETAIAGMMAGPEVALVYNLTRKAADVGRNLVDMVGFASYGGFAHLVASSSAKEIRNIYLEIRYLRLAFAISVACAFLVVNQSLIRVWVGDAAFGGPLLTGLFAVQLIATGESYLVNYLFRATGEVEKGSWILAGEASGRMVLMIVGMWAMGLPGIPLAAIALSIPFLVWTDYRLNQTLPTDQVMGGIWEELGSTYLVGGALLVASGVFARVIPHLGWIQVLATGSLVTCLCFLVLTATAHAHSRERAISLIKMVTQAWSRRV